MSVRHRKMAALPPILIIDDEKDNLDALTRLLRSEFRVESTPSPFEALKLVRTNNYHVVVSDQRMPEMTGVELLEKVKSVSPLSTRILLTGYTDIDSVIQAINRGNIYRYIAKPWDPEDLILTLKQAAEAYRLRFEIEEKNRQLSAAVARLEVLDRAKARFLGLVSHELRTPITVLASFTDLLASQADSLPSDVKKSVSALGGASARLGAIVDEVLDYLRVETLEVGTLSSVDLAPLLQRVQGECDAAAKAKNLSWKVSCPAGTKVVSQSEGLALALRKLFLDAVTRSDAAAPIELTAVSQEGRVVLTLQRTGEVITPQVLEPLEMAGPELNHHRNLGLHLATAKALLTKLGSTLSLQGSTPQRTVVRLEFSSVL